MARSNNISIEDLPPPSQDEMKLISADSLPPPSENELLQMGLRSSDLNPIPERKGKADAALQGFGNAATLGYLPEIQSLAGKMVPNPSEDVDADLTEKGFGIHPLNKDDSAGVTLDEARRRNVGLMKGEPGAYLSGSIAGSVASSPLYGGLLGKVGLANPTGLVSGVTKGAIGGGALGLVSNPNVMPEDEGLNVGGRIENAGRGAKWGAALGAIGGLVGGGKEEIRKQAGDLSASSLRPTTAQVASAKGRLSDIGNTLLKEKIVTSAPKSSEELGEAIEARLNQLKPVYENAINNISDGVAALAKKYGMQDVAAPNTELTANGIGISKQKIIENIQNQFSNNFKDADLLPGKSGRVLRGSINRYIKDINDNYPDFIDIKTAQKIKNTIGAEINWDRPKFMDIPAEEQIHRSAYYGFQHGIEDAASASAEFLGPEAKQNFLDLKRTYGNLARAGKIVAKTSNRDFANRYLSMSDYQAGQLGGAAGLLHYGMYHNPVTAVAIGAGSALLNRAGRLYANQPRAVVSSGIADALENSWLANILSQAAGSKSASGVAATMPQATKKKVEE